LLSAIALTHNKPRLANVTLTLADGRVFNLGRPGSWRHDRRLRKYIRARLRREPAFRAEYGDRYTRRGRPRA
jgi:hypothetical protein